MAYGFPSVPSSAKEIAILIINKKSLSELLMTKLRHLAKFSFWRVELIHIVAVVTDSGDKDKSFRGIKTHNSPSANLGNSKNRS